jgi:hypothetical protein
VVLLSIDGEKVVIFDRLIVKSFNPWHPTMSVRANWGRAQDKTYGNVSNYPL